jgi:TfoX/Sxy family transcriptional regulator of competence genes
MPYNEKLADKIREKLAAYDNVDEMTMMGGLTFMLNDKMCVGIIKDELMCHIDSILQNNLVEKIGCRVMDFTNRPMKGYILIEEVGMKSTKDFNYWVDLAIAFNKFAKSSKRKK